MFDKTIYMGLQKLVNSNSEKKNKEYLTLLGKFCSEYDKKSHSDFYNSIDTYFKNYLEGKLDTITSEDKEKYLDYGTEIYKKIEVASKFYPSKFNNTSRNIKSARIKEINSINKLLNNYL